MKILVLSDEPDPYLGKAISYGYGDGDGYGYGFGCGSGDGYGYGTDNGTGGLKQDEGSCTKR